MMTRSHRPRKATAAAGRTLRRRLLFAFMAAATTVAGPAEAQTSADARSVLSLDSLLNVQVSAAARYAQTTAQAPASVTVITADDIARFGYRTLADVFESVRGFYVSSDLNYSYVGVRGFSRPTDYNNRLVLLLNGRVLNETFYNLAGAGGELIVDLQALERIEVVRGPSSALYGTSAMLSVVNLVTKTGLSLDAGIVAARVGSHGRREFSGLLGRQVGGVDVMISTSAGRVDGADHYFPEFDDPSTNDGIAAGLDWEEFAGVLATLGRGGFSLDVLASLRNKGVPTASWESNFNDDRARTRDRWAGLALRHTWRGGGRLEGHVRGHAGHYAYDGRYPADVLYEDENEGLWGGVDGQLVWSVAPGHRLTAGGEVIRTARALYTSWSPDEVHVDGDFPFTTASLFAMNEVRVARWLTLTGGLRYDAHSAAPGALSPRLAAVAVPRPGTALKLLWGEAFRAPSVYEREYADETFKRASGLDPERIRTAELVLEQRAGRNALVTVSAYRNRVRGLIDTDEDPVDELLHFVNRSGVRVAGVEAELSFRLPGGSAGYASYAWAHADDAHDGAALTNAPRHLGKAGASVPVRIGSLAAEARYEDGRRTVYDTWTPGVVVANAHFASRPYRGGRLTLRVRNLFDADFRVPGGYEHVQATLPQGGRTLLLGMEFGFR